MNKMVYRNDGSSHHDGIKGECKLIHMINTDPKFSVIKEKLGGKLEHRGGTKSTADAVSERGVRISIKTKNSNSGSFDWFNKSYVHDTETDTKKFLNDIKNFYRDYNDEEKFTRKIINELSNTLLKCINIRPYIDELINNYKSDYICINFVKRRKFVMFHRDELKVLFYNCENNVNPSNMCTSCTIPGSHSLRIRLVLNNGVKAILKRGSYLCVKLQQDNPQNLEKYVNNAIVIYY